MLFCNDKNLETKVEVIFYSKGTLHGNIFSFRNILSSFFQYTGCPEKEVSLEITLLLLNVDYYASGDLNELST